LPEALIGADRQCVWLDPGRVRLDLSGAVKAWCHAQNCAYFWSEDPMADRRAAGALIRAVAPNVGEDAPALVALAAGSALTNPDFRQAEAFVDRALAIDPNNAWGWMRKGWNAVYRNLPEAALEAFDRAERLSPLDPFHFNMLLGRSAALRQLRRIDEAIALIEAALREGPGLTWAYRMLYGTHMLAGNLEAAERARQAWHRAYPALTATYLKAALPAMDHDEDYIRALLTGLASAPKEG
jgi:tetratricopeptide (TPR) repeat protein